jgi:AcrR family transcriptional regulator
MTELATRPKRRTQAERRATTRTALLEATIDGLVESGYAGVTTADIATRANVTRGALAHNFTNKADLVTEAVRYLAIKLVSELQEMIPRTGSRQQGMTTILDLIWNVHRGPIFTATAELWIAARTDPDLRESLQVLVDDVNDGMIRAMAAVVPDVAAMPGAVGMLTTTMSAMRGLAMLSFVEKDVSREWKALRRNLLDSWNHLLESSRVR